MLDKTEEVGRGAPGQVRRRRDPGAHCRRGRGAGRGAGAGAAELDLPLSSGVGTASLGCSPSSQVLGGQRFDLDPAPSTPWQRAQS